MSATVAALIAEGDRWLEQAADTYRGGGAATHAAACAAIATAYYGRAAVEKQTDTFGALVMASMQQRAAAAKDGATPDSEAQERQAAKASGRHPAGRRLTVTETAPEGEEGSP